MQALLKIDGKVIKTPSSMEITYQDYDSSESNRNAKGELIRERVRAGVRRIDVGWKVLYGDEMAEILQAVKPVFFTVEFLDPATNSFQSMIAYVGDRQTVPYTIRDDMILYTDFKIGIIEK